MTNTNEFYTNLIALFEDSFQSDDEAWNKKGYTLVKYFESATEDQKEVINRTLIVLCGWSLDTLIMRATNGEEVENIEY